MDVTEAPAPAPHIAVALSGGGHRSCLFGLGVLLYLADAGLTRQVTSVASVSGGSLANGAITHDIELSSATPAEIEAVVGRVAHRVAHRGSVFGWWPAGVYVASLPFLLAAALVGPWLLDIATGWQVVTFGAAMLVFALFVGLRGRLCGRAFAHTVLSPGGRPVRLADVHGAVEHVFCATDLHAGENVYFGQDFVTAFRFGHGTPGRPQTAPGRPGVGRLSRGRSPCPSKRGNSIHPSD